MPKKLALWFAIAALALAGGYWLQQRASHVYSDDARIASDMIEVSAKLAGQVVDFPVREASAWR